MTGNQGLKLLKKHKGYKGYQYQWIKNRCEYMKDRKLDSNEIETLLEVLDK